MVKDTKSGRPSFVSPKATYRCSTSEWTRRRTAVRHRSGVHPPDTAGRSGAPPRPRLPPPHASAPTCANCQCPMRTPAGRERPASPGCRVARAAYIINMYRWNAGRAERGEPPRSDRGPRPHARRRDGTGARARPGGDPVLKRGASASERAPPLWRTRVSDSGRCRSPARKRPKPKGSPPGRAVRWPLLVEGDLGGRRLREETGVVGERVG